MASHSAFPRADSSSDVAHSAHTYLRISLRELLYRICREAMLFPRYLDEPIIQMGLLAHHLFEHCRAVSERCTLVPAWVHFFFHTEGGT